MRLCRYDDDRLGLVETDRVADVTEALNALPLQRWPLAPGDPLIANLPAVQARIRSLLPNAPRRALADVRLNSPVPNPSKVMAAPANYREHIDVDVKDPEIDVGVHAKSFEGVEKPTEKFGLFLKSGSGMVGPSDGVEIHWPDRRSDHEAELVVVIGKEGKHIGQDRAMEHVAGYTLGLDMTIRGAEDRSFRKSADSYTVAGPWLVTADEIEDVTALDLALTVNGSQRQRTSTSLLLVGIPRLIELVSSLYTLYPGDLIFTGTPAGVGQVQPGDEIAVTCTGIGELRIGVRAGARA